MGKAKDHEDRNTLEFLEYETRISVRRLIQILEEVGLIAIDIDDIRQDGEVTRTFINDRFVYKLFENAELFLAEEHKPKIFWGMPINQPYKYAFLAIYKELGHYTPKTSVFQDSPNVRRKSLELTNVGVRAVDLYLQTSEAQELLSAFFEQRSS